MTRRHLSDALDHPYDREVNRMLQPDDFEPETAAEMISRLSSLLEKAWGGSGNGTVFAWKKAKFIIDNARKMSRKKSTSKEDREKFRRLFTIYEQTERLGNWKKYV